MYGNAFVSQTSSNFPRQPGGFKTGSTGQNRSTTLSRTVTPPRSFKIRDFDYNMFGESCESILGPIFMSTKFESKTERNTLAKEILNLVISICPITPIKTKRICSEALRNLILHDFLPELDVKQASESRSDSSFAMNARIVDKASNQLTQSQNQTQKENFDLKEMEPESPQKAKDKLNEISRSENKITKIECCSFVVRVIQKDLKSVVDIEKEENDFLKCLEAMRINDQTNVKKFDNPKIHEDDFNYVEELYYDEDKILNESPSKTWSNSFNDFESLEVQCSRVMVMITLLFTMLKQNVLFGFLRTIPNLLDGQMKTLIMNVKHLIIGLRNQMSNWYVKEHKHQRREKKMSSKSKLIEKLRLILDWSDIGLSPIRKMLAKQTAFLFIEVLLMMRCERKWTTMAALENKDEESKDVNLKLPSLESHLNPKIRANIRKYHEDYG